MADARVAVQSYSPRSACKLVALHPHKSIVAFVTKEEVVHAWDFSINEKLLDASFAVVRSGLLGAKAGGSSSIFKGAQSFKGLAVYGAPPTGDAKTAGPAVGGEDGVVVCTGEDCTFVRLPAKLNAIGGAVVPRSKIGAKKPLAALAVVYLPTGRPAAAIGSADAICVCCCLHHTPLFHFGAAASGVPRAVCPTLFETDGDALALFAPCNDGTVSRWPLPRSGMPSDKGAPTTVPCAATFRACKKDMAGCAIRPSGAPFARRIAGDRDRWTPVYAFVFGMDGELSIWQVISGSGRPLQPKGPVITTRYADAAAAKEMRVGSALAFANLAYCFVDKPSGSLAVRQLLVDVGSAGSGVQGSALDVQGASSAGGKSPRRGGKARDASASASSSSEAGAMAEAVQLALAPVDLLQLPALHASKRRGASSPESEAKRRAQKFKVYAMCDRPLLATDGVVALGTNAGLALVQLQPVGGGGRRGGGEDEGQHGIGPAVYSTTGEGVPGAPVRLTACEVEGGELRLREYGCDHPGAGDGMPERAAAPITKGAARWMGGGEGEGEGKGEGKGDGKGEGEAIQVALSASRAFVAVLAASGTLSVLSIAPKQTDLSPAGPEDISALLGGT